jgi:hypothetical protein
MGLSQNCWREDEMLARKALELVIVGPAVRFTSRTILWRTVPLRAGRIFNLLVKFCC